MYTEEDEEGEEEEWRTFKFCDICSFQVECVYFYTAQSSTGTTG